MSEEQDDGQARFHVETWADDGDRWEVIPSDEDLAVVDVETRTAVVPRGNQPSHRAARLHEAIRAAVGKQQLDDDFETALEEVRLGCIAEENGIDTSRRLENSGVLFYERRDERGQFKRWSAEARRSRALDWLEVVAVACTAESIKAGRPGLREDVNEGLAEEFSDLMRTLSAAEKKLLAQAAAKLSAEPDPLIRKEVARQLGTHFGVGDVVEYQQRRLSVMNRAIGQRKPGPGDFDVEGEGEGEIDAEDAENPGVSPDGNKGRGKPGAIKGEHIGLMEIHRHVGRGQPSSPVRKPRGAADIGHVPTHWERWAEDKHVFVNRRPGGTIVIDASGSMGWDLDELRRAIKSFPAVKIAAYSGSDADKGGRLCILAEDGSWRQLDPSEMQGGNGVDLEALQWLALQRGPRVWLSDGYIIGGRVNVLGQVAAKGAAQKIAVKGRIVRAENVKAAVRYLRTGGSRNIHGVYSGNHNAFALEHVDRFVF